MSIVRCVFFFFQAEDGIRDLVRSRGLGDVYKRQAFGSEVLKTFGTSVDLGGEPEGVYVARVFMGGLGNYAQVVRLVVAR